MSDRWGANGDGLVAPQELDRVLAELQCFFLWDVVHY